MRSLLWTTAAVIVVLVIIGCSGGSGGGGSLPAAGSGVGTVTVRVTFPPTDATGGAQSRVIPVGTSSIALQLLAPVTNRPLAPRIVIRRSPTGGTQTARFAGVRAGPARLVVTAHSSIDGSGVPLAQQHALVIIRPGATTFVSIELESTVFQVLVSPPSLALDEGGGYDLQAEARNEDGDILLGATFHWSSDDPAVATVDAAGHVTAVAPGHTLIRATEDASGIVGTCQLQVVQVLVVSEVRIEPDQADLDPGDAFDFTVAALDQNGDPLTADFNWTTDDPGIATVNQQGRVQAVAPGVTLVRATETITGLFDTAVVIVNEPPHLDSVVVTPPSANIAVGGSVQLAAAGYDQFGDPFPAPLTWQSDDAAIAAVSPSGLVTGVASGQVLVRAVHLPTGIEGACLITVTPGPVVTTVLVTPAVLNLNLGETGQLTAEVRDQNGQAIPGATVNWGSAAPGIATVDQNGQVLAVGGGSTTIFALEPTSGVQGAAQVNVTVVPVCTRIEIEPTTATVQVGQQVTFTATAFDQFDNPMPGLPLDWSSDNTSVASVNQSGVATGVADGQTQIHAQHTASGCTGDATLTVTSQPPALSRLVIDFADVQLKIGGSIVLSAGALDQYGDPFPTTINWRSLDPTVAQVEAVGSLQLGAAAVTGGSVKVTGLKEGQTQVEAQADGQTATTNVEVTSERAVDRVIVTPSHAFGALGETVNFHADAVDYLGHSIPGKTFTWVSSAPDIAATSATGAAQCLKIGGTTISATETESGKTGQATLTVVPQRTVTTVRVIPSSASMTVGDDQVFSATAYDQYGSAMPGRTFSWATVPASVLTVKTVGDKALAGSGTATITAVGAGKGTVIATDTASSISGSATVVVTAHVSGVVIGPD